MVLSAALPMAYTNTTALQTELSDDYDDSVSTVSSDGCSDQVVNNSVVVFDETPAKDRLAFGNVAITNSSDVHFGNKTYYQGPVTIKQFLYASSASEAVKGLDEVKCENGECEVSEEVNCRSNEDIVRNDDVVEEKATGDKEGKGIDCVNYLFI